MTMSYAEYLDAAIAVFEERLGTATHLNLSAHEPFASDAPPGVGGPLRTLSLHIQGEPFAILGLTAPTVAVEKAGLVEYLARRARARRMAHLVVSNLRDCRLLPVPSSARDLPDPLKHYRSLYQIAPVTSGGLSPPERNALAARADEIALDLATLYRDGSLDLVIPDADFFVDRLTGAVDILKPAVKQALITKLGMDPTFAQELSAWAVRQGIPADMRSDCVFR